MVLYESVNKVLLSNDIKHRFNLIVMYDGNIGRINKSILLLFGCDDMKKNNKSI